MDILCNSVTQNRLSRTSYFLESYIKFLYSEKATKFCEIFTLLLTLCTVVKSKVKITQNFVAFSLVYTTIFLSNFQGKRINNLLEDVMKQQYTTSFLPAGVLNYCTYLDLSKYLGIRWRTDSTITQDKRRVQ